MINPAPAYDSAVGPADIIVGRTLPRVRSLQDAAEEIRREDPDTPVTPYMLRRAVKEGRLPAVRSGRAIYVSIDAVRDWLLGK